MPSTCPRRSRKVLLGQALEVLGERFAGVGDGLAVHRQLVARRHGLLEGGLGLRLLAHQEVRLAHLVEVARVGPALLGALEAADGLLVGRGGQLAVDELDGRALHPSKLAETDIPLCQNVPGCAFVRIDDKRLVDSVFEIFRRLDLFSCPKEINNPSFTHCQSPVSRSVLRIPLHSLNGDFDRLPDFCNLCIGVQILVPLCPLPHPTSLTCQCRRRIVSVKRRKSARKITRRLQAIHLRVLLLQAVLAAFWDSIKYHPRV
mmetsp:Transcript_70321/g.187390  ORF Transcript_70321/g.187390 Transcript_70321/m.187390 type:complete len:260 (+) Transcript_70321:306-1085(+)